ncbi:MAG: P1 family peptidase [Rhodospirillaceae bacterium]|jgi:L-aminopeptidase/D-esterase-like protein|nr:P1 family peptidase [Rhodospirillaceae bacterium]MBT5194595.1 P1 family peptidase [Rhodospirillaceae bacterium]MBT5897452.1 P1 family peptidase [Rhodospirillaceae bacterium]MBT6427496.1 P1 family peptidase [Rhodospirillaceae bacterium]MBT7758315.1 P1 family peptidase [Rhodospirillaceae bacterium]
MIQPGPRNLLTDVDGLTVGNAVDETAITGVTVVLPEGGALASADVRGGGPGTREIDLLDPTCRIDRVDGICLSGGSVHGIGAGDGVVRWLHGQGRGFSMGTQVLPIVPGAIIYDLGIGGETDWGRCPDYMQLARAACEDASTDFALGNIGAGLGACAGRLKGGLGSASVVSDDGVQVAALVVANPVGAVVMPGNGTLWPWAHEMNGEMGRQHPPGPVGDFEPDLPVESRIGGNTTLAVVATNAAMGKADAKRVAMMAHDGLARAIRPVHTPFDGDTIFALSTARMTLPEPAEFAIARIGALAADCLSRAIGRAVFAAEPLGAMPSYRQSYPEAFADDDNRR